MELTDSTQGRLEDQEPAPEQKTADGSVSLFVRLWTYGGPWQQLSALTLDREKDPELQQLIDGLITDGRGQIIEQGAELLVARFHAPFYALSAAKALQQRLLTFQRKQPPQQVVPSILIAGQKEAAVPAAADSRTEVLDASNMLADRNSAQILVAEGIYELARNAPGFKFNPKPVREAGENGAAEAVYELLWTDESTYGHLREVSRSTGITTAGRYQIVTELGRGAMGVVYKALDQLIGRTVALKTISINRNAPNHDELIERLKQEGKAAGSLDHPNIITIYDVGQEDDLVYLSMQFVEGQTLATVLADGELPPLPTLISYAEQICSAVGFAHARSVIHRDLKPANLMLTNQGVIKVLDFGIAKIEDATLTQTGLVVGTPAHMAPEQASGKKIDHRTDIFALGSVFYELFTREKPFKGDVTTILYKIMHEDPVPPSVINPALPGGIDAIIRKALSKDLNDRFQSCEEMCKAFSEQAALLTTAPKAASTASTAPVAAATGALRPVAAPAPRPRREVAAPRPRRQRFRPGFVAVLMLAAVGVASWSVVVKARTGSFPPVVQKALAVVQRWMPDRTPSASTSAASGSLPAEKLNGQTSQNSPGNGAANVGPANPSAGSSAGAGRGDSLPALKPAENSGASTAPSQPPSAAQSTSTVPPNEKPGSQNLNTSAKTSPDSRSAPQGNEASVKGPGKASDVQGDDQGEPATGPSAKGPARKAAPALNVDGFTGRDVPELLQQAEAAAGRGDYRLARYEYNLILKLDRNNAAARSALRRIQAPQQDSAQH